MYCVVQETEHKRPNRYGYPKSLYSNYQLHNGTKRYSYQYSDEFFDRPLKKAYKITIHQSKRVNGKVVKEQYTVATIGYYDFVKCFNEWWFDRLKLQHTAECLKSSLTDVEKLIRQKLEPIAKQIALEFEQTEEYRTHTQHQKIISDYEKARQDFAKKYHCSEDMYDYVYDIFGKLMNKAMLDKIIAEYTKNLNNTTDSTQERTYYYSLLKKFDRLLHSTPEFNESERYFIMDVWEDMIYSDVIDSGYCRKHYTDGEKQMLKKMYRTLAKKYHSDITGSSDDAMKLINKLKTYWRI